ncbi:rho GTPase-activating protein 20-like isoform X2 [Antennarius striatus]|uniref:rho GTPase-activating protein 20-like isoform X2 n=1 Tax=Antennarius striatus TaxID=241820 RepID=UPI0035B0E51F
MDIMSPQQQQDSLSRGGGQQENKRRMKCQSYRRQSAPSLVITKALTRSKTLSRESFLVPVCPETCPLVQSFLGGSDRSFLLYGHAQLRTGMQTQDRHLFLFTDILVTAKAKSANHYKQKAQVCVCEMWTAGCLDEVCEGSTNAERSFVVGWPTCNYVATFGSEEQKEKWLSVLKSRMKEEKEREEPKTIPLRVYGKGINSFAVAKTLPVSNSDSTNEVVRLALQQFGIIGNVRDYQLWVISKRDNVPYPLIGHEFPFSIQMSHVRDATSHAARGGRDAGAPPPPDRRAEQLQVSKQCQFILKPRPVETLHVPAVLSQKPFKRRKHLMTWAFWRGSSPNLNDPSLSAARGCLFGQSLSSVCGEDGLPKPIMEMLSFLYSEGSWTRGIFRRPAGARAVRELRDTLDGGDFKLPLTRDHIYIIAGVFKDFLRSIPGSLLCCELHEEWMDVLEEEEEEEEQVQDIKRMIDRVPKENAALLRYLLAMLHGIQGNAQENQMTSFNLSVCIAPSLLWPPTAPSSPEVEGEGTKKVCELVKFMIEHCQQILGEDPTSLFGGPPQRLDADEAESDSWLYPLTDSSYDSLENELDDSGGVSPGSSRRRHRAQQLQGSLDSILTFSDYEQDAGPEERHKQTDTADADTTDPPSDSQHAQQRRRRRRSEPALAYAATFGPCVPGGEDLPKKLSSLPPPRGETRKSSLNPRGVRPAVLEVSSPSLSSTPTSPAPTCSPLDSPDSLGGDHTWVTRPTKTQPPSVTPSTPLTPSAAVTSGGCVDSPPKEQPHWGALRGCRGLHPNSWLKKGRRLSLTQQDNLEKEGGDKTGGGHVEASRRGGKPTASSQTNPKTASRPPKDADGGPGTGRPEPQYLQQDVPGSPLPHRPTGSLQFPKSSSFQSSDFTAGGPEKEATQPSPSLFYRQTGPSLSLFKKNKSEQCKATLNQRRRSEPGRQVIDRAATPTRARLPSDPGLKVTEVDSQGGVTEARFCLSPYATKAVRDYFSSHPCSHPQSGQQVALALVESHREWLKRCSDPTAEPDLEQLLFAEESYV